ncbi:flagellar hook-basal body complex protein FliE [Marinobacter zhanjiangensis]|uniref:Flagellar hook-basal body complex protein FliE n=1 Tax=Marinobacter zhanjiangensis TaxID=578215 RepID=A0ABQ3AR61_9GAMM|nr:flagellar hook-basal body complex protein FliE [Marinobacter zhanjiangensis]GGY63586.1 flagellar hook-basal body complex protein FliE [Marinobacter zhanjiangensis]
MVERADINNVLSEMRNLRSQMTQNQQMGNDLAVKGQVDKPAGPEKGQETPGFGDMLSQAVDKVNDLQSTTGDMRTAYEQGDPNVDITQVMVASQKSSVAFEGLSQVRNRVVKAYEDIMNMPI